MSLLVYLILFMLFFWCVLVSQIKQIKMKWKICVCKHALVMCPSLQKWWLHKLERDNTKRRAGRAGGPCYQIKNMNFPWVGELHRRAGWQAAQQDRPVGCTLGWAGGLHIKLTYWKGRAGGLPFSATHPALFRNPLDRLFVQPALLSSVQPVSPPKVHVFHLETRPSN